MNTNWTAVQKRLLALGYDLGPAGADGIPGRYTTAAIVAFQGSVGLDPDGIYGPLTSAALMSKAVSTEEPIEPPWMVILDHKMGLQEKTDNAELRRFLASDGSTLGDPAKLPWCGDLVETCIALALPREVLPSNPYYALNWAKFGRHGTGYGAVASFHRTGGGHVGFLRGERGDAFLVGGGNQSNQIKNSWVAKDRLEDIRVPITYTAPLPALPKLQADGQPLSTNEA